MTMSSQRSGARRKGLLGAALLIVFLLLLLGLRAYVLAGITTGLTDCTWCMGATAVQQHLGAVAGPDRAVIADSALLAAIAVDAA